MVWWLYNILFTIGFILLLPRFFARMLKRGGYRKGFGQRLTWYDKDTRQALTAGGERIWIHAVSVGELFVALRFIDAWRASYPATQFVLTTTTSTGHALARDKLKSPDLLLYFPVDTPPVMRRAIRLINPRMLVLVEAELWPNLIRHCNGVQMPVVLINGRISARSFRGYQKLDWVTQRLLPKLQAFCMQGPEDAERIIAMGAPAERVEIVGSAKYEIVDRAESSEQRAREVLDVWGVEENCPVLLGGSTWPGEEEVLLDIYSRLRQKWPSLKLILAPRHVERAAEITAAIESRHIPYVRRSRLEESIEEGTVLLLDTTGELKHFYAHADIIFVGKSLSRTEGQNIIEPAVYGKPVLVGPRLDNFESILADFKAADAIWQVPDEAGLEAAIADLLADPARRAALGELAAALVKSRAGALQRTLDRLSIIYDEHSKGPTIVD